MNDIRHDPDEGWYTVPDGEQPWGKTVRHVPQPDGTVLTQTNVPPPEEPTAYMALYVDGNGRVHVRQPDGAISPLKWEPQPVSAMTVTVMDAQPVADHDCATWTERTERRLAALEDAVNRIADRLTYLLIKLEGTE